jgi:5-formyltetrahydrofolate cyclo-ligase
MTPELRAWRKETRRRLLAARAAIALPVRQALAVRLAAQLGPILAERPGPVSFYWPIKAEPDLRPLMQALDAAGTMVCLPVCEQPGAPLKFRRWHEGCRMQRGFWDIPIPADPEEVTPRTLIAPIVGFSLERDAGWRLGYGGGFFDRTLAALGGSGANGAQANGAQAIGIGTAMFRLATITPQPHDVPMAMLVTEQGVMSPSVSGASPVCAMEEAPDAYAGFATAGEIAATLTALRAETAPERHGLIDYALWRLGEPPAEKAAPPASLEALLPRVRDDALHAALTALQRSLDERLATAG